MYPIRLTAGLLLALLLAPLFSPTPVIAQTSAVCSRLEAQLGSLLARGSNRNSRRFDGAIREQEAALRRTQSMARRSGCTGRSGRGSPQCRAILGTMIRMEENLVSLRRQRDRAAGGSGGDSSEIRRIRAMLEQNGCTGQRQRQVRRDSGGGLFGFLRRGFERDEVTITRGRRVEPDAGGQVSPLGGSFRTVCVRTCDGYFFPVSFATGAGSFEADEQKCASMCGGSETQLYVYRMPSETLEDARTLDGQAYKDLSTAFLYQREFVDNCSCQAQQAETMLDEGKKQKAEADAAAASGAAGDGPDVAAGTGDENEAEPGLAEAAEAESPLDTGADVKSEQLAAVEDDTVLRDAKTGLRDVYLQPKIDESKLEDRYVVSYDTYPPLPLRRPDPSAGETPSDAR